MSKLTEGLKRIDVWLQVNMPERPSQLISGISHNEIKEQVQNLPFNLPDEVYELYEWHNGDAEGLIFDNYNFLSLRTAVATYREWLAQIQYDKHQEAYFLEKGFPIFELWSECGVLLCLVCDGFDNYPIRMLDTSCKDYSFRYRSLTDLILHVADWYELAKYYEEHAIWDIDIEISSLLNSKYLIQK